MSEPAKLHRTPGAAAKAAAREAGLKQYFTGLPCKNGHVTARWVSCGSCIGCQEVTKERLKDYQVEYHRRWRAANRESVSSYTAKWRQKNPTAGATYMANRRASQREEMLAAERGRYAKDPARFLAKSNAYLRANKILVAAYARARRARRAGAEGFHTAQEIELLLGLQRHRCAFCLGSLRGGHHADHIMPLVLGGTDLISNIQMLCPTCNLRKGPKHPVAFAQMHGRLL
jgi:5-methylcytosine-specific restriction endonuclease McrA